MGDEQNFKKGGGGLMSKRGDQTPLPTMHCLMDHLLTKVLAKLPPIFWQ